MAENEETGKEAEPAAKSSIVRDVLIGAVSLAFGAGTGVVAPSLFPQSTEPAEESAESSTHLVSTQMDIPPADEELAFIEFDEIIVNLNDARYSRFLNCRFSLQVAASQKEKIEELVEKKSVLLKNWIISHLRDKQLESVKGMVGQNALRREIHDQFNAILFTDGVERIQDILFQDLKVQ